MVVRQVWIREVAAERELQNFHSGKIELVPQLFNIRRDEAQVFSDERKAVQRFANAVSNCFPGAFSQRPTRASGRLAGIAQQAANPRK